MIDRPTLNVDICTCARCGTNHDELKFTQLRIPMYVEKLELTHWAICPVTNEPIVMRIAQG